MSPPRDFWARRKAAVQAEAEQEDAARVAKAEAEARAELDEKTDAEILQELGLPDPDSLDQDDDISGFMKQIVPERLRRRALRRFWRLNPVLANLDGLVDYGEDFTDSATVIENLQTAYQVGKGMLSHVEEIARRAAETEKQAEGAADDGMVTEAAPDPQPPAAENQPADVTPVRNDSTTKVLYANEVETSHSGTETDVAAARPPRMRFEFEG